MDDMEIFKQEIKIYIKKIYDLILEEYKDYLSDDKKKWINNFNYEEDIIIDNGSEFSSSPGRFDSKTKKIHLSPKQLFEKNYKDAILKDVEKIDIALLEEKFKNSANETFTEEDLLSYIKQKKLNVFDIIKGIIIHEIMHSIISIKIDEESFCVSYNNKIYECNGVKGEYLDEGLVEYFSRKFANEHNYFFLPSIPYQENVEYVKQLEKELGKNIYKLAFNNNYKSFFNYIHEVGLLEEYNNIENKWLTNRIINRIKNRNIKEGIVDLEGENNI